MPSILCEHCTAACCRYIALPVDEPESHAEFEDIRWFLLHEEISVFVEDGDWYISMHTPCRHLQPDHRCGIYETRPKICRTYTTEACDYHSGDYGWEHHFTCPEHLDEYIRTHAPPEIRRRRKETSRRPQLKARPTARRGRGGQATEAEPQHDRHGVPLPVLPVGE